MASRRWHLIFGLITFLTYLLLYGLIYEEFKGKITLLIEPDFLWVSTAFFMALVGSEGPDWDHLLSWLRHRDIMTHSFFIPGFISMLYFLQKILTPGNNSLILAMVFAPFCFGYSSHLLLDLFPTINPEKEIEEKGITKTVGLLIGGIIQGLTGKEIVSAMRGTFLIHLPLKLPVMDEGKFVTRKTLPLKLTRWWLFTNGIITALLGLVLIISYLWF